MIVLPLIRFGPALYAWQTEARVWRHDDTLRRIESEAERTAEPAARAALPVTYRRHVFALRRDIAHVRELLAPGRAPPAARSATPQDGIEDA